MRWKPHQGSPYESRLCDFVVLEGVGWRKWRSEAQSMSRLPQSRSRTPSARIGQRHLQEVFLQKTREPPMCHRSRKRDSCVDLDGIATLIDLSCQTLRWSLSFSACGFAKAGMALGYGVGSAGVVGICFRVLISFGRGGWRRPFYSTKYDLINSKKLRA